MSGMAKGGRSMVIKRFKSSSNFIPPLSAEPWRKIRMPIWLPALALLWLMPLLWIGFGFIVFVEVVLIIFSKSRFSFQRKG